MAPRARRQIMCIRMSPEAPEYGEVLSTIEQDLEDGTLSLDEHSRVILLSDGYATDISVFSKNRV